MSDAKEITATMAAIVKHLITHPTAVDTPSGIACWWMDPEAAVEDVQQALECLQKAGFVEGRQTLNGRTLYGRRLPH
jgi:hypothetical protein